MSFGIVPVTLSLETRPKVLTMCNLSAPVEGKAQKGPLFWGLWFSQVFPFSRNSCKGPFKLDRMTEISKYSLYILLSLQCPESADCCKYVIQMGGVFIYHWQRMSRKSAYADFPGFFPRNSNTQDRILWQKYDVQITCAFSDFSRSVTNTVAETPELEW